MATTAQHLPYLDGWRGLAIALLLVGHFFPVPGLNFGEVGVNLFFVLSGLLMARLLFIDETPLRTFYVRRISRIFPALYFYLIFIVALYGAARLPVNWTETGAAAGFVLNYFPGAPGAAAMPFGHIWSLCVEEHSYIALSLLAIVARRTTLDRRMLVGALAAACACAGWLYWASYTGGHYGLERALRTEVAAFGLLASALLMICLHGRALRVPGVLVLALLATGMMLHWWSVPPPVKTVAGVGLFALAINLLGAGPAWLHALLSVRPLQLLGLWSYSIYLWQQPFYLLTHRTGLAPSIGLALSVAAGIASFYLLEQPARRYLNKKWQAAGLARDRAREANAV